MFEFLLGVGYILMLFAALFVAMLFMAITLCAICDASADDVKPVAVLMGQIVIYVFFALAMGHWNPLNISIG